MPRLSSVLYLQPEQRAQVDACIRRHQHVNGLGVLKELGAAGINLSRSSLYRYMEKLRAKDALHTGTADDTVVVIVERATGATTTLTTSATGTAVLAMISNLGGPS